MSINSRCWGPDFASGWASGRTCRRDNLAGTKSASRWSVQQQWLLQFSCGGAGDLNGEVAPGEAGAQFTGFLCQWTCILSCVLSQARRSERFEKEEGSGARRLVGRARPFEALVGKQWEQECSFRLDRCAVPIRQGRRGSGTLEEARGSGCPPT